jgi:hypothetical protein
MFVLSVIVISFFLNDFFSIAVKFLGLLDLIISNNFFWQQKTEYFLVLFLFLGLITIFKW